MVIAMSFSGLLLNAVLAIGLLVSQSTPVNSQSKPSSVNRAPLRALRDGQRDFDFDFGAWKTHSSRLLHPLTGSKEWADMDGITVVKKIWDGRANIAEYKADGPAGHVELLSLRWYNSAAHQWNLDFATPNVGALGVPAIGEFKTGRGDFYDQEEINGRYVLVRFSIWSLGPDKAQSEQAFSADGGKTWEVNWVNKYERISDNTQIDWSKKATSANDPGQYDFDFNVGVWRTQITRVLDPFAPSPQSIRINGTVSVRKIWGGRAQLEEIEADGPKGHWEALTLFLYNPRSHQWSQSYINGSMGVLNSPLIGAFKDGRGELLCQDTFKDKSILVEGVWSEIEPNSHRYEELYSDDGAKSWKPAFIAHLTRAIDAHQIPEGARNDGKPGASATTQRESHVEKPSIDRSPWK